MEFPVHELNLWAEVYKTEYYDAHPEEREEMQSQESDIMTSKVLALIGGDALSVSLGVLFHLVQLLVVLGRIQIDHV